jgi:hypothetical protein
MSPQLSTLQENVDARTTVSSYFSDQLRHIICRIPIYGFVDINFFEGICGYELYNIKWKKGKISK